jgi:uncharacterized protein
VKITVVFVFSIAVTFLPATAQSLESRQPGLDLVGYELAQSRTREIAGAMSAGAAQSCCSLTASQSTGVGDLSSQHAAAPGRADLRIAQLEGRPPDPARQPGLLVVVFARERTGGQTGYEQVTVETEEWPLSDRTYSLSATCVSTLGAGKKAYALLTNPPENIGEFQNGDKLVVTAPRCAEMAEGAVSRRRVVIKRAGASPTTLAKPLPQYVIVGDVLSEEPADPSLPAAMAARDCEFCPRMVNIPGGSFLMGSDLEATEKPIHEVTVAPFMISQFPITVAEWKQCVLAKSCSDEPVRQDGSDASPVHNVSWEDAERYVEWITQTTQQSYRLPSEAEWEYAARAGTSTPYWWGDRLADGMANCQDCGQPYAADRPLEAGSLVPNPFGLFGVAGGVNEWVADCWHQSYEESPADGTSWDSSQCQQRVLRGGSWKDDPNRLRTASRDHFDPSARDLTHGFRIARASARVVAEAPTSGVAVESPVDTPSAPLGSEGPSVPGVIEPPTGRVAVESPVEKPSPPVSAEAPSPPGVIEPPPARVTVEAPSAPVGGERSPAPSVVEPPERVAVESPVEKPSAPTAGEVPPPPGVVEPREASSAPVGGERWPVPSVVEAPTGRVAVESPVEKPSAPTAGEAPSPPGVIEPPPARVTLEAPSEPVGGESPVPSVVEAPIGRVAVESPVEKPSATAGNEARSPQAEPPPARVSVKPPVETPSASAPAEPPKSPAATGPEPSQTAALTPGIAPQLQPSGPVPTKPVFGKQPAPTKQSGQAEARYTTGLVIGNPQHTDFTVACEIASVLGIGQETGPHGEVALRVMPMVSTGGIQNIIDVLTLPGADMAIVPAVMLNRVMDTKELGDVKKKLVYIAPLFLEEFHVLALAGIRDLHELAGKTVNLGEQGSATEVLGREVLSRLGIKINEVNVDLNAAVNGMRKGQITATLVVSGKPVNSLAAFTRAEGFHLLAIPYLARLHRDYLPSTLIHEDYPNLIAAGDSIDTISVSSILVAYNWPRGSERFRLLEYFVHTLFSRLPEFQTGAHHPKWQEVNLAATMPGWRRFGPAESAHAQHP